MFLTRFQINPRRRGALKLLNSPHAMHAAVLSGFPNPEPTPEGRILWRLDATGPRASLYIVSPQQPSLEHLVEQAGWPSTQEWETRSYRPLLDRVDVGQQYAFRITANPVHSVRSAEGTRGKPLGHVTATQQTQWFLDRQDAAGFSTGDASSPPAVLITNRQTLTFSRQSAKVTLRVATYEGALTVTDRERFVHTLTHGIGRAKGYGCGLLTIAAMR